jgi:hypothetical protein
MNYFFKIFPIINEYSQENISNATLEMWPSFIIGGWHHWEYKPSPDTKLYLSTVLLVMNTNLNQPEPQAWN